ncbi:hypothetical protein CVH10_16735 [Halomonas sp. ND22Bw]|uniref:DUF4123 domain-containing protein n=1 Tax=Halomonas sp. ND22Bw TaxID=2054178 RepID=UPI000D0B550C|nr:hypothetical protein CVH10_16735 [Halomonas sp. ND22Bw]
MRGVLEEGACRGAVSYIGGRGMTRELRPDVWRNVEAPDSHRYALIEMGALPRATRTALIDAADGHYWSLIRGTQQEHLIREGPWLMTLPDSEQEWQDLNGMECGLMAWLESPQPGDSLARQLAPAMTVMSPEGKPWLMRFYLPPMIQALHAANSRSWYRDLFNGIERWWYPTSEEGWQALAGLPDDGSKHDVWRLDCDSHLWDSLKGNTEATALTAQLVSEMPELFENICPCDRPGCVAKALFAADEAKLSRPEDRRIYVYLWLEKEEAFMQSDLMRQCLEQAACGDTALLECLQTREEY